MSATAGAIRVIAVWWWWWCYKGDSGVVVAVVLNIHSVTFFIGAADDGIANEVDPQNLHSESSRINGDGWATAVSKVIGKNIDRIYYEQICSRLRRIVGQYRQYRHGQLLLRAFYLPTDTEKPLEIMLPTHAQNITLFFSLTHIHRRTLHINTPAQHGIPLAAAL